MTAAPDENRRVAAVFAQYRRRQAGPDGRDLLYAAYIAALLIAVYLLPFGYLAATMPPVVTIDEPGRLGLVSAGVALVVCAAASGLGRMVSPLLLRPFLLYVFANSDLAPRRFLSRTVARRLVELGLAVAAGAATLGLLTGGVRGSVSLSAAVAGWSLASGAAAAAAWLLAATCSRATVILALVGLGTALAGVTLLGGWVSAAGGTAVIALFAALAARFGARAMADVDVDALMRESVRLSQARDFMWGGNWHYAADVYRPPAGSRPQWILRKDGTLRSHLVVGCARMLRTPSSGVAAVTALLTGGASVACATTADVPAPLLVMGGGTVLVHLGSGCLGDGWRGMRDEIASAPCYGDGARGMLTRNLAWPVIAVLGVGGLGAALGAGAAAVLQEARTTGWDALVWLLALIIVLSSRYLAEMKSALPVELLTPVITPFGDAAGLRVLAWQFDGLVIAALGGVALVAVTSPVALVVGTLALAAYCVWKGTRQARS